MVVGKATVNFAGHPRGDVILGRGGAIERAAARGIGFIEHGGADILPVELANLDPRALRIA